MAQEQAELLLGQDGPVATVTISHPAKRNAMTSAMWEALPPLLERLAADPRVRVLVLTGAGDTFCAGADISGLIDSPEPGGAVLAAEQALAAFPRPTLAVVRGSCVGGGCQLAVACDLRFAAHGSRFGVTPARLGIVYPASSTRRLAALVGPATAKHLLFSAELIDAERALRTGLADELWPDAALDARVAAFTTRVAERSAITQIAAKEAVAGASPEREAHWRKTAHERGEVREGVAAFMERRAPVFGPPPTTP